MSDNNGFKLTSDGKSVTAMLESVLKRGNKLMDDIHVLCGSLIMRAIEHGDVDGATRLVNGLGGGFRCASISKWLITFGCFAWVKDADKKLYPLGGKFTLDKERRAAFLVEVDGKMIADLDKMNAHVGEVMKVTFWDFDPPKAFNGFNLREKFNALIKEAEAFEKGETQKAKRDKGIEVNEDSINLTGLEKLRHLAKTL